MGYTASVKQLLETERFSSWFSRLKDARARAAINARLRRVELGNLGDCGPVGEGVSELRIHYGPGYRVYFVERGMELVVLLAGGDKSSQERDIGKALELAREL
jgi:putative addiction module killer protein